MLELKTKQTGQSSKNPQQLPGGGLGREKERKPCHLSINAADRVQSGASKSTILGESRSVREICLQRRLMKGELSFSYYLGGLPKPMAVAQSLRPGTWEEKHQYLSTRLKMLPGSLAWLKASLPS